MAICYSLAMNPPASHELKVFFSNRLEVLYQHLKTNLFEKGQQPMMRRLVVVYGPAMKSWIMLRMAQDPTLNVAMGIEFVYLNQAFETLSKLFSLESPSHIPTLLELSLAIERELLIMIDSFNDLTIEEQHAWDPIIQYLKLDDLHFTKKVHLSRKMEKRLVGLSKHLARLFQDYGRYAHKMISKWESTNDSDWQARLWRRIFQGNWDWTYPGSALLGQTRPRPSYMVHLFSISFMTSSEFSFLQNLASHLPLFAYLLSPCAVFWSDIRSDRESTYLQRYWQRKLGSNASQLSQLEELLRDKNPLLANFGRLGRQMAHQIEESQALPLAHYVLPESVCSLHDEFMYYDDLYMEPSTTPPSLLQALQADLLLMRNPQGDPPHAFEKEKGSVQVHIAPGKRREVQILYHNLLKIMEKDNAICPLDVIVMAPDIQEYAPYIHSIFGARESQLDYQILDLGMQTHNDSVQGFLQLLQLSESRWDCGVLLQLFEHRSFRRRHQITAQDFGLIKEWVEQTGILWGDNRLHRNELLLKSYCEQGMVDETNIGTWDYGLTRLLMGLATVSENSLSMADEAIPSSIEFSQGELLGKWIQLLHSLRDDLSPLQDRSRMTMDDWVNYLLCLLDHYFQPDHEDSTSLDDHRKIKEQFEVLRTSSLYFKETLFSFPTIKSHLVSLLDHQGSAFREDHLQAIRFCSLMPMRSIPAKVIALLGMQEGSFPRLSEYSSLNRMIGNQDVDYFPLSTDFDRYLFLEILHSAREYLLISYQGYSQKDSKELQPSLVVEELFSYLEKYYTIGGEKVSKTCFFKHPFDSYDARYFNRKTPLYNYSQQDFEAARAFYRKNKSPSHFFIKHFTRSVHPQPFLLPSHSQIDLKHLTAAARNPIKFHLQKVLEIYLEDAEARLLKTEEQLILSRLDQHQLKQCALKESVEMVMNRAQKGGKLPFGLFKTVAERRLKNEINHVHTHLQKHGIDPKEIFQIEFNAGCTDPTQLDTHRWVFPPYFLSYEDGYKLSITGKISHATSKGLVALSKGSIAEAWKMCPQFLLYCHAAHLKPDLLQPQLIMVESAKPYASFYENLEVHMKRFMNYYGFCLQHISPLVPDWIPLILEKDAAGLQNKIRSYFGTTFGGYQCEYVRWALNRHSLPCSETIIEEWKEDVEAMCGDFKRAWFPSKATENADETVRKDVRNFLYENDV